MRVVFEDLPVGAEIQSIGGVPVNNLTATGVCDKFPHWFKMVKCRVGLALSTLSNYGAPYIKLTYNDGTTDVTIEASDLVGGRPVRRPNRPTFPTNPQNP